MKRALPLLPLLLVLHSTRAQQMQLITGDEQRTQFENKSYLVVKSLSLKPGFTASGQNGAWYAKMHPDAVPPAAPSPDQNFVRQHSIITPGVTNEQQVRSLPYPARLTTYQYMDGAGKHLQTAAAGASPAGKDALQASWYDDLGRPARFYLPYAANATSGTYREGALAEQAAFYNNTSDKISDDARPYNEVSYDNSPLNRITQSRSTGAAWATRPINNTLKINDAVTVQLLTVSGGLPVSTATWPAGSLAISETQDEENFITRTYTDMLGRTVLTESSMPGGQWARTYTVFDDYGKPLFIIPPAASSNLTPDHAFADQWYFQYQYDEYQRAIAAKAPGTAWVYTIYDQWDRPVFTQDGNQRSKNPAEWSFVKYDDLNRPVASGIYKTNDSRATLTATLATFGGRYETRNTSATGYTLHQTFPTTASEADLLSISYYDDYAYTSNAGWDAQGKSFAFVPEPGYTGAAFTTVKDLGTGSKVRIIGTDTWLNSVTYYDNRYRPLQTITENHFEKLDRLTTEYDFTSQVLKTKHVHTQPDNQMVTVQERHSYDHAGRLLNTWHQVNSRPEVLLASLEYNETGQVVKKKLHVNGASSLQALDYRYDIQGKLTQINYTNPDSGDPVDYFSQALAYHNGQGSGNTARYDGLITGQRWKHDTGNEKAYNYTYDAAKRLSSAGYVENAGAGWMVGQNLYNESAGYDLNGNITSLSRNGNNNQAAETIDQLNYSYTGNQLTGVADNAPAVGKPKGFNDGNTTGNDYLYDANGNLTQDKNKNFTINYNSLNLPERITFAADNSYWLYTYTAGGARVTAALYNSSHQVQFKTDYAGMAHYVNGALSLLHHAEGRCVTPAGDADAGIYQYYLTDHLGNVRVVLSTQVSGSSSMMATMEESSATREQYQFLHYDKARRVKGKLADHTRQSSEGTALRLTGLPGERQGLATSLSVMPGDTVSLQVFAKYISPQQPLKGKALALVDNLIATATGKVVAAAVDGTATAIGETALPFGAVFTKADDDKSQAPRAYLNWLLFDRNFVLKDAGYKRLSEQAREDGSNVPHEQLTDEVVISEAGYLYAYLSNESEQPTEVYFDDFSVTVTEGPVIQLTDYYPYGLPAYTWVREGEQETRDKFQGKEYEERTGLYDFHARQYDPILGRFKSIDPANQFASGYIGMGNNPVMMIDPDGEIAFLAVVGIFAAVNLAADAIRGDIHTFKDGAISFGIGALQGVLAAAGPGGLAAYAGSGSGWLALGSAVAGQINIPVYQSDNFNLSISPSLSAGSTGARLGANVFASATVDNVTLSGGYSFGRNFSATDLSGSMAEAKWSSITSGNVTFGGPNGSVSLGMTRFGGNYSSTVGSAGFSVGRFGFVKENDFLAPGNQDKYRTGRLGFSYRVNDDVTLTGGFEVFTGKPTGETIPNSGARSGLSHVEDAPLRNGIASFGVNYRGNSYRLGVNSEGARAWAQNGWHDFMGSWVGRNILRFSGPSNHFTRMSYRNRPYTYFGNIYPFTGY